MCVRGDVDKAYQVGEHNEGFHQQFPQVCPLVRVGR